MNQTNETNQLNETDRTDQINLSASGILDIREAYLVIHAGLARKAGRVGRVIFASRACRARLACLAHNSRTTGTDLEWVAKNNGFAALRAG